MFFWPDYVLRHLTALLAVFSPLIAHDRSRNISGPAFNGVLEWTLPMGFDDGQGNVRLTVVAEPGIWGEPLRVRVAVSTIRKLFQPMQAIDVTLPRYIEIGVYPSGANRSGNSSVAATQFGDPERTRGMATYLCEQINGDTNTLQSDLNGYWSFTVVVAEPYRWHSASN